LVRAGRNRSGRLSLFPETGPDSIEDGEGDISVEAELSDCGGDGALPLDQADEGHDDASVRRAESDRILAGRQVVVEAARVDGKELGKESESIASGGLEGHWEKGSGEMEREREDEMMGNESKYYRRDASTYLIERRTGEKSSGSSGWERRRSHKAEGLFVNKSVSCDIFWEAFRKFRTKKSVQISRRGKGLVVRRARYPEREGMAIEKIERTAEDVRTAHKQGQNWISMR
jgi:hypothetical protein